LTSDRDQTTIRCKGEESVPCADQQTDIGTPGHRLYGEFAGNDVVPETPPIIRQKESMITKSVQSPFRTNHHTAHPGRNFRSGRNRLPVHSFLALQRGQGYEEEKNNKYL